MTERFEDIVIGTGQAGPPLARRLAGAGRRVAVIERQLVGGTCVNVGCTPTKALVASARAAHMARRAGDFGIQVEGDVRADIGQVMERAASIARESREGLTKMLTETDGIELVRGHARLAGDREVVVSSGDGERRLTAERIFLNVGARARTSGVEGLDDVPYLTNTSALALDQLPEHLIIVGASYIGLEFGQAFRRLGSRVTIVEKGERAIAREDEDISSAVQEVLEREGVEFVFNAECLGVARDDEGVRLDVRCDEDAPPLRGSHVLLAIGRVPNTDDLGLEAAGVKCDERGHVEVDDSLRTGVEGIWALGDCNGRGAFTHTSYNDYEVVASQLFDDEPERSVAERIPCYGLYVDPPLGRVGMTTEQARRSGKRILVGELPMKRVGRARERSETDGLMRFLVDGDSQRFLGAAVLGIRGDEVVHTILAAMESDAPYTALARSMFIHPTVNELVPTALQNLEPLE